MIKKNPLLIFGILTVLFLGGAIYSNTFQSRFQFDDLSSIVNNPFIRDLSRPFDIFNSPGASKTRGVTMLSFALNYHFHQLDVFGYHVTNFLIHLLTTGLVWGFVYLILSTPRLKEEKIARHKNGVAFLCALLFLSHPGQTQAITYITQRYESLATLFYMASACCYLKGRLSKNNIYFLLSLLAAVTGMFTKEIVITLPLNIILLEFIFFKRESTWKTVFYLTPILLLGLILPYLFSFNILGLMSSEIISESHDGDVITFGKYVLTQFRVGVTFLKVLFFPAAQNLDYDFPLSKTLFDFPTFFSLVTVLALLWAAFKLRARHVLISFGIFWFFIAFAPNALVPRANIIAEHKLYLLSVGFCIALGAGLFSLADDFKKFAAVTLIIVGIFSFLTFQRNKVWRNEITLWTDVVQKSPGKSRGHVNLGKAYTDYGRPDLAKRSYEKAIAVNPESYRAYSNRGLWHYRRKQFDSALADYNKALAINPKYVYAYMNRVILYRARGEYDLAWADCNSAMTLKSGWTLGYLNCGNVLAGIGDYKRAIEYFTMAINREMVYPEVFRNRGNAYKMQGKADMAIADYNRSLEIDPQAGVTYFHRSLAYHAKGNFPRAMKDARQALSLGFKVDERYLRMLQKLLLE